MIKTTYTKIYPFILFFTCILLLNACSSSRKTGRSNTTSIPQKEQAKNNADKKVDGILWFAKQQLGTPYKYGSSDPKKGGLDCSGFLYYVFTHFNISVPRTSNDYMTFGKPVSKQDAAKGDIIIFTGSDATQKTGGHVGLILENKGNDISFIHGSTSKGVIINKLSDAYYNKRFLKIVRVLN